MLARSAAARAAIAAYASRPAISVRCAPETEKSIFARLNGRPNDEDMVAVLSTGIDKQYRDRWDCVRRGVILRAPDSVVVRNELPEADLTVTKRQDARSFKAFPFPRADILIDAKTACAVDFTTKKKVYFYDAYSVGVAKFARAKVDFVTDDPALVKALSQILPKTPKSAVPRFHQPETTGLLLHSLVKDDQAGAIDAYVMYDSKLAIARGAIPSVAPILDAFANMAASRLASSDVFVVKGDIHRDSVSGEVSLILGGSESAVPSGTELQGTKYAAWGAAGVSRLFEGSAGDKDLAIQKFSGVPRSVLNAPKRIVFAVKKDGKPKQLDLDAAKKLFVEKYALAAGEKTGAVFEKLIQATKPDLVVLE